MGHHTAVHFDCLLPNNRITTVAGPGRQCKCPSRADLLSNGNFDPYNERAATVREMDEISIRLETWRLASRDLVPCKSEEEQCLQKIVGTVRLGRKQSLDEREGKRRLSWIWDESQCRMRPLPCRIGSYNGQTLTNASSQKEATSHCGLSGTVCILGQCVVRLPHPQSFLELLACPHTGSQPGGFA